MVFECGTTNNNNNNNMSLFTEVPYFTAATKPRSDDDYDNDNDNSSSSSNSRARKSHNAHHTIAPNGWIAGRETKRKKTKKGTGKPKTKSDFLHVNTTEQPGKAVEAWS